MLKVFLLIILLCVATACSQTATKTPSVTPTPTSVISLTPTQSPQNQQPIEVVSALELNEGPTVNPGGGIVEITLKNVDVEPIVSLALTLTEQNASWNFDFGVNASHPLLPAANIKANRRLIGGGWGGGPPYGGVIPYSLAINGTLQSGATFAFTWGFPK